jgi:hypothetical protein
MGPVGKSMGMLRINFERCVAVSWLLPLRFLVQTNTNRESQLFKEGKCASVPNMIRT